ncbi:MAG TPA: cysteine hydrolase [Candidatus Dormibacteraeota bacterium]|jgi:nicotinamidase-related amidase|nr:cysteine hydrolase [Candidatus Dormibacteraeota bacterium]
MSQDRGGEGLSAMVDPRATALLIVDVQNDFVHAEGWIGRGGADTSASHAAAIQIGRLIDAARRAGALVVYIRTEHGPAVDTAPYRARYARRGMTPEATLCHAGTWGSELYTDLRPPEPGEPVLVKHGYDAFSVDALPELLQARSVRNVVVVGVVTNLCVRATTFSAFERGFFPVVPQEATAATEEDIKRRALQDISDWYGEIPSIDEVIDAWRGSAP